MKNKARRINIIIAVLALMLTGTLSFWPALLMSPMENRL